MNVSSKMVFGFQELGFRCGYEDSGERGGKLTFAAKGTECPFFAKV